MGGVERKEERRLYIYIYGAERILGGVPLF